MNILTTIDLTDQRYLKASTASKIRGRRRVQKRNWFLGKDGKTHNRTGNGLNAFFMNWGERK